MPGHQSSNVSKEFSRHSLMNKQKERVLKIGELHTGPVLKMTLMASFNNETPLKQLNDGDFAHHFVETSDSKLVCDFLHALIEQTHQHPIGLKKFIGVGNANGATIGHIIASLDKVGDDSSVETYLELLEKLAEKKPRSVIQLLGQEDSDGRRIVHLLAESKEPRIKLRLIRFLSNLSTNYPSKVFNLMTLTDHLDTIGHILTEDKNSKVVTACLKLLMTLAKTHPEGILDLLMIIGACKTTIAHFITMRVDEKNNHLLVELLLELHKEHPERVLQLVTFFLPSGANIIHFMLVDNIDSSIPKSIITLLDKLADSNPQAVWNLLLSGRKTSKLGTYFINPRNNPPVFPLLFLLTKLFRTVNIFNDFEVIETEPTLNKEYEFLNDFQDDYEKVQENISRSIIRSLFNKLLDSYKPRSVKMLLEFLMIAIGTDLSKTRFLLERSKNTLIVIGRSVMATDDAECIYQYTRILDLMGDVNAINYFLNAHKHTRTAELITTYVKSEPYTQEKKEIANNALTQGTTLNHVFAFSYSKREKEQCCFIFFNSPQEWVRTLSAFLARPEEQPALG